METLIGAAVIAVAIVVAARIFSGRARPVTAVTTSPAPAPAARDDERPVDTREREELERRERELEETSRRVVALESALERRSADLDRREAELERREQHLVDREAEVERLRVEREQALARVAGLSPGQAKQELLKDIEDEARHDAQRFLRQIEEETKRDAERRVRSILSVAMQRMAAKHAAETTVSVVELPSDDMKGRIIGREGRNIRALEHATGIDLIIDDTPEAVVLSSFDPVRREVARIALTSLIADGRITPQRIEEQVAKAQREVEQRMKEDGEAAILELGIQGAHPEIVRTLGRLRYRTSYGQNVLAHSKEVAFIASMIASEIGANVAVAKRAALFHDLGKAVSHEQEGSHAVNGAEIARKYGESPAVVHAIAAHHNDEEPSTVEAVIVLLADAISAARPGARRDNIDIYIKRLEKLEEIATSFPGIEKSYAIQAGREIRVMVQPDVVDDTMSAKIARDIAKRIESEMEYPGMIKVTVIRETRSTEYAK